jgi:hypothetical protein
VFEHVGIHGVERRLRTVFHAVGEGLKTWSLPPVAG